VRFERRNRSNGWLRPAAATTATALTATATAVIAAAGGAVVRLVPDFSDGVATGRCQ